MTIARTADLARHKVRVTVGPYMTICKARDVWKVKQEFKKMLEAPKKKCPTCNQEV